MENNETILTKGNLLLLLILFLFSNKIIDIIWDIGKSLFYLIIIINILNYLNPEMGKTIKEIINDFINIDNGIIIKDTLSKVSSNVLPFVKPDATPYNYPTDLKIIENRDLENIATTNNRTLSQT